MAYIPQAGQWQIQGLFSTAGWQPIKGERLWMWWEDAVERMKVMKLPCGATEVRVYDIGNIPQEGL